MVNHARPQEREPDALWRAPTTAQMRKVKISRRRRRERIARSGIVGVGVLLRLHHLFHGEN
jgi:hypothetical protein